MLQNMQNYSTKYESALFTRPIKLITILQSVTKTFLLLFMYKLKQMGPLEAGHKSKILKIILNNEVLIQYIGRT